jgi:hypothetical protein
VGRYDSFVVRIRSGAAEPICGNIVHVSSGDRHVFRDPEEIIRFIYAHLNQPSPDPRATGPAKPDQERRSQ